MIKVPDWSGSSLPSTGQCPSKFTSTAETSVLGNLNVKREQE
jgi:hypothetical protein